MTGLLLVSSCSTTMWVRSSPGGELPMQLLTASMLRRFKINPPSSLNNSHNRFLSLLSGLVSAGLLNLQSVSVCVCVWRWGRWGGGAVNRYFKKPARNPLQVNIFNFSTRCPSGPSRVEKVCPWNAPEAHWLHSGFQGSGFHHFNFLSL